jgi:transposase
MIPVPSGVRVWLATGPTDMRRGMNGLAIQVQETLRRDPHGGHLFVFRGKRGDLIKVLWHDGQGMCLFAKRLERGRFIWPQHGDGVGPSRRRNSATFWKGSIGACRDGLAAGGGGLRRDFLTHLVCRTPMSAADVLDLPA